MMIKQEVWGYVVFPCSALNDAASGKIAIYYEAADTVTYIRTYNEVKLLVILNFFEAEVEFKLTEDIKYKQADLLISNYDTYNNDFKSIILRPYEARVYILK